MHIQEQSEDDRVMTIVETQWNGDFILATTVTESREYVLPSHGLHEACKHQCKYMLHSHPLST